MVLDPVVVASNQYKVVVENERVRLLKIEYGAYETGPMHYHPDSVLVCLTEMNGTFTYPDGRTESMVLPPGAAMFLPATTHQPENKTPNRIEAYLIELKR